MRDMIYIGYLLSSLLCIMIYTLISLQMSKEKYRLKAMMQHLQMKPNGSLTSRDTPTTPLAESQAVCGTFVFSSF